METESRVVVAAQPGFFMLELISDETGCPIGFDRHPIVAWVVTLNDDYPEAMPVLSESTQCQNGPVMYPGGAVSFCDLLWGTPEEWLAYVRKERSKWSK